MLYGLYVSQKKKISWPLLVSNSPTPHPAFGWIPEMKQDASVKPSMFAVKTMASWTPDFWWSQASSCQPIPHTFSYGNITKWWFIHFCHVPIFHGYVGFPDAIQPTSSFIPYIQIMIHSKNVPSYTDDYPHYYPDYTQIIIHNVPLSRLLSTISPQCPIINSTISPQCPIK